MTAAAAVLKARPAFPTLADGSIELVDPRPADLALAFRQILRAVRAPRDTADGFADSLASFAGTFGRLGTGPIGAWASYAFHTGDGGRRWRLFPRPHAELLRPAIVALVDGR